MLQNILEIEALYNPYLRLRSNYYQDLFEEKSQSIILQKLKKFELMNVNIF